MRTPIFSFALLLAAASCGDDTAVNSNEQARRAYLGLDKSVSKCLALGFQGYNAASNANIPAEMANGDLTGTVAISGHVDQGNPGQVNMNLAVDMIMYSDNRIVIDNAGHTIGVTYATATAAPPALSLKLNSSSGNALTGTLMGDYQMTGDLTGKVTLNLQLSGTFSGTAPNVTRVAGSTHVTGTATNSAGGVYMVDVMI
jgi:hypothetical protein